MKDLSHKLSGGAGSIGLVLMALLVTAAFEAGIVGAPFVAGASLAVLAQLSVWLVRDSLTLRDRYVERRRG